MKVHNTSLFIARSIPVLNKYSQMVSTHIKRSPVITLHQATSHNLARANAAPLYSQAHHGPTNPPKVVAMLCDCDFWTCNSGNIIKTPFISTKESDCQIRHLKQAVENNFVYSALTVAQKFEQVLLLQLLLISAQVPHGSDVKPIHPISKPLPWLS
jgi:hypothetical protein